MRRRDFSKSLLGGALALASARAAATSEDELSNVLRVVVEGDPTGQADSTIAFSSAAGKIQAAGGGILKVPEGVYRVGKQTFANGVGKQFSYSPMDIISISNCTRKVTIDLSGVTLRMAEGLRFGSFDPIVGSPVNMGSVSRPYYNFDSTAQLGYMLRLTDNEEVEILGAFELDGNITSQIIGGRWGDTGWQLTHTGICAFGNRKFAVRLGGYIHDFGTDGVQIGWPGMDETKPICQHVLEGLVCRRNGRLGLAWVGGNHLRVRNCSFSDTGWGDVWSMPGSGVDIENETGNPRVGLTNGSFENCEFKNNRNNGIVSDSSPGANITIDGCRFYSESGEWCAWLRIPYLTVSKTQFVGGVLGFYESATPDEAVRFTDCTFSTRAADSPSGKIGRIPNPIFETAPYATFIRCTFNTENHAIQTVSDPKKLASFVDCVFNTAGDQWPLRGHFYGLNHLNYAPGNGAGMDTRYIINYGVFIMNGRSL